MRRIYIIGETTYDIIFKNEKPVEAKVGGSQLNTAVSLGRAGLPVSFITQFGDDKVGTISQSFLKANGIDTSYARQNPGNSRIALAFLDENNNADYSFFKAAESSPFHFPQTEANDIVLFGSSFALRQDIRSELVEFLQACREKGSMIIYDPNYRKANATDLSTVKANIELAHMVKGSDEDFENIFGAKTSEEAWAHVNQLQTDAMFYTAGKKATHAHTQAAKIAYPVKEIQPVSTIGAGDNFNAGLIYSLFRNDITVDQLIGLKSVHWTHLMQTATDFAQHVCLSYDNYISQAFADELARN